MADAALQTMTSRERMLGTLRQEEVDRFPVWLKMASAAWRLAQPEPYASMSGWDILVECGCDLITGCAFGVRAQRPHVEETVTQEDGRRTRHIRTPDGDLTQIMGFDSFTRTWHPVKYAATTADELRCLRWYYQDTSYTRDEGEVGETQANQKALAEADAITSASVGPSPLMDLIQHLCGPMDAIFLMTDEAELFEEIIALMHQDRLRELDARLDGLHADTFWLTENTSTSLINPDMFRHWCLPQLTDYGNKVLQHSIIPVHHMCGMLDALLGDINTLPALANEAFTTPPVGNTTLADGRRRMPSKALIGGTNASLWLDPADVIIETVAKDLEECPDRRGIFLTSAGVLPAQVTFNKAAVVVAALKELPVS